LPDRSLNGKPMLRLDGPVASRLLIGIHAPQTSLRGVWEETQFSLFAGFQARVGVRHLVADHDQPWWAPFAAADSRQLGWTVAMDRPDASSDATAVSDLQRR
jgi:hypothetical protein